jgi:dUTP pyrophosphatase
MAELRVAVERLAHGADLPLPAYATAQASGLDLLAAVDPADGLTLAPAAVVAVPTGLRLGLPPGVEAQVRPRSGLALRHGVTVLNSPGTIDADYRGEIGVVLINLGADPFRVERGMRIAQMVVAPVTRVAWQQHAALPASARAAGGFGSTGIASYAEASNSEASNSEASNSEASNSEDGGTSRVR